MIYLKVEPVEVSRYIECSLLLGVKKDFNCGIFLVIFSEKVVRFLEMLVPHLSLKLGGVYFDTESMKYICGLW